MNWIIDGHGQVHLVSEKLESSLVPSSRTGCGALMFGHGAEDRPEGTLCKECESKLPVSEEQVVEESPESVEESTSTSG